MATEISFIHAADLHLDSPFKGLAHVPQSIFSQIRQSTFHAFDHLVKLAIEHEVDFIVLVGDLFDNEKQSLKAQVHLRDCFQKLHEHNINVYLSYGNHDYVKGNVHPITYPENVFIFENETVTSFTYKNKAKIYGFSYENRAVLGNKSDQFNREDDHIPFHIAMLHGTLYGNEDHDPYAPFQLHDLQQKMFDYWALGHIHKREILSEQPPIVYSGNIQGRHRHEHGEKGCYIVTLSKEDSQLQFVPLQSILFRDIFVDITDCQTIHDVEPLIYEAIEQTQCAQLLYITFKGHSNKIYEWQQSHLIDDMIDIINESLIDNKPWTFIYRYTVKQSQFEQIKLNDYFIEEYIRSVDEINTRTVMEQLLNHREAKKYVTLFTDSEQKEIKERAKQLVMNELFSGRD